jgi:hypothetical protein
MYCGAFLQTTCHSSLWNWSRLSKPGDLARAFSLTEQAWRIPLARPFRRRMAAQNRPDNTTAKVKMLWNWSHKSEVLGAPTDETRHRSGAHDQGRSRKTICETSSNTAGSSRSWERNRWRETRKARTGSP